MSDWYRWDEDALVLTLRLHPRAPHDQWTLDGTQLKVRITTPPVDGLANQHLLKFAANSFGVSLHAVRLLRGKTSRHKVIRIQSPSRFPETLALPSLHAHVIKKHRQN